MVIVLIFYFVPRNGRTHMIVYIGICSLMGSLTVMCVKAVSIALKLTLEGNNQFKYFQAWFFTIVVIICCLLQINYLNKEDFENYWSECPWEDDLGYAKAVCDQNLFIKFVVGKKVWRFLEFRRAEGS